MPQDENGFALLDVDDNGFELEPERPEIRQGLNAVAQAANLSSRAINLTQTAWDAADLPDENTPPPGSSLETPFLGARTTLSLPAPRGTVGKFLIRSEGYNRDYQQATQGLPQLEKQMVDNLIAVHSTLGKPPPTQEEIHDLINADPLHESVVGISPEAIDYGHGPVSGWLTAVGKGTAGLGQFMTSPSGFTQQMAAATPAKVLVIGKWFYDMSKGAVESGGKLKELLDKPNKTPEDYQEIRQETINTAMMLGGATLLARHQLKSEVATPFADRTAPQPGVSREAPLPGMSREAPAPSSRALPLPPLRLAPAPASGLNLPPPIQRPQREGYDLPSLPRGATPPTGQPQETYAIRQPSATEVGLRQQETVGQGVGEQNRPAIAPPEEAGAGPVGRGEVAAPNEPAKEVAPAPPEPTPPEAKPAAKPVETEQPAPAAEKPDIISKLESLKYKDVGGGVGANPFPEIGKAVWNTAVDIAIASIKAGRAIGQAVDDAMEHIRKNATGFNEADVRSHFESVLDPTGEVRGTGGDVTGLAERVRKQREASGRTAPTTPGEGIAPEASVERGRELWKGGADPEKSMAAFEATGKFSADDVALVRAKQEALARGTNQTEETFGAGSDEFKAAFKTESDWSARTKKMQTEWAKAGHAQQGEVDIDTGTFSGLARAHKKATGKDFTPKQEKTAKAQAGRVKKAKAEAEAAQAEVIAALDKEAGGTLAEKRALAAASKTVREHAIRLADAETKTRVAKTVAERAAAKIQEEAARRALVEAQKAANEATARLADAENKARVKAASPDDPNAIQKKAAKDAVDAANKTVQEAAARLALEENKKRVAKTVAECEAARVAIKRAKAEVDAANKRARLAAIAAAKAESKLRVAKADRPAFVWSKAREYIEQGVDNFDELRNKIAAELGLTVKEVTTALAQRGRVRQLSNEMWKKQQIGRRVEQQAKQWLRDSELPLYRKAIESVPRILFGLKVGFHGTVALGTHAPMVAFQPMFWKTYIQNFGKMYRMVGSKAYYEMQVQDLLHRPNYLTARRAGLINDPFHFEDYNSPAVAKYLESLTRMGNRGYSVLKMLRQDMFDQHWNNLPRSLQQPEIAAAIADGLNHATGVVKGSAPPGSNIALFAPRLEASRVAWLLVDPAIAMKTALEWRTATRAEKHFAISQVKEKAWVAGTLFGMLAINQGLLSAMDSKQKVNFDDPMKGDFLKFKVAGMTFSYGNAMLTMARLPVRLYQIRQSDGGKLKNLVHPDENTYTVLGEYARSQLSPFASLVSSLWFKADWQNRPLPNSNRPVPKRLAEKGTLPYTWPEFWTEQVLPIPFEEAAREVWHGGLGMSDSEVTRMRKAMATIAVMGATGGRLADDYELKQKPSGGAF